MKYGAWNIAIGIALIATFFSIVGMVAYLLYGPPITIVVPDFLGLKKATTTENTASDPLLGYAGILFECDAGSALKAEFLESSVHLALSDGRRISLPQVISASGVKYANTDDSFIFCTENNNALVEENGSATYINCTTAMPN